jgi:hypothetical protein
VDRKELGVRLDTTEGCVTLGRFAVCRCGASVGSKSMAVTSRHTKEIEFARPVTSSALCSKPPPPPPPPSPVSYNTALTSCASQILGFVQRESARRSYVVMSDSPVYYKDLLCDSVDEASNKNAEAVTPDALSASSVTLPIEILDNIVQFALARYRPGRRETARVRRMATVSRSFARISQRALFRHITLGGMCTTEKVISHQAARLRLLAARPDLAPYVFEVNVWNYVLPEAETLALLAALPKVDTLYISEGYSGLTRGKMAALIDVFPRLRTLVLRDHRFREDAVAPMTTTLVELDITGGRMKTDYLECLSVSPMGRSLRSARIRYLDLGASGFAQGCKHIFRFENITVLDLTIEGQHQAVPRTVGTPDR